MATVNFMLTSPIAVDGDMNVTETKMVMRVNELFQELRQISGVQVAMSDIGYADGTDYCATVSMVCVGCATSESCRTIRFPISGARVCRCGAYEILYRFGPLGASENIRVL